MRPAIATLIFWMVSACGADARELPSKSWETIRHEFTTTPLSVRPGPLWFWNDTRVDREELKRQMASYKATGYGGLSILPFGGNFRPEYLSEEYMDLYEACAAEARELGMTLWLYDEYGFPSGSAGLWNADGRSRFGEMHPDHVIKRLDKEEYLCVGGENVNIAIPEGSLMAAVAMDTVSFARVDLSPLIVEGRLDWVSPPGKGWKIMFFICRSDEAIVDYLDPRAVRLFTEMTHDRYYERLKDYFGSTIIGTFFDEPTLYRAKGRSWTVSFNDRFEERYGFSPALYYPALWYDIGEETHEARNYLFGFRSELYALGYTKVVGEWSRRHGLWATGHQDNEEIVNAVGTSGDLMKCFKYLDIPGIDKIGGDRPAEKFYKVVSSAAYNWDHSLVMSETYGAMGNIGWDEIYGIAMDQYSKGVNLLIPHAVWYDPGNVTFLPELSSRNPVYAEGLPAFNSYLSRLNALMQNDGRWVGDIAILYPVETMQGEHHMDGPLGHYRGGVEIPGLDYIEVSTALFDTLGHDYMWLHPEVMDEKCTVRGRRLVLDNETQYGDFAILVIPGCKTISLRNLEKAQAFVKAGGTVLFTSRLPEKGMRAEDDRAVRKIVEGMFPAGSAETPFGRISSRGEGAALLVENPDARTLREALSRSTADLRLRFSGDRRVRNIHKVVSGKNVWFFANPTGESVDADVWLKGDYDVKVWDPHTGEISESRHIVRAKGGTEINLRMDALHSLFIVEE